MAKKFSPEWWQAQRPEVVGKETEKLVEDVLRDQNRFVEFAWHRLPDAKAARGALAAQPADYLIACRGRGFFLEVKALKHEFRLPKDRVSQLPTLKKFGLAGVSGLVMIHHYTIGQWRIVPASSMQTDVPSWDLSSWPTYASPQLAMCVMGLTIGGGE